MSQQPDPARPRPRRATTRSKTPPSNGSQLPEKAPARPASDDREGWKSYWEERQQPWRIEPEIDAQRQHELAACYKVPPDIEKGTYPFRGRKLSRAEIEWLLVAYKDRFTPEKGLDVRGADLDGVNLSGLPLIGLHGGLAYNEWEHGSEEQRKVAAVHMSNSLLVAAQLQGAHLCEAQLQGADLREAQLRGAILREAQLQEAHLFGAQLQGADLNWAQLQGADLNCAQLQRTHLYMAQLRGAQLQGADLREAYLQGADLRGVQLVGAILRGAQLQEAHLFGAQLQTADLHEAQLQGAFLQEAFLHGAQLQGAFLHGAQLQGTHLYEVQLQGADLREAQLQGAQLNRAQLQDAQLNDVTLANPRGIGPQLADIRWDGVNLAVIDWSQVEMLGNEYSARQKKDQDSSVKDKELRLNEYREAVRANRQVAVALQTQGLNEEAARFAYRANVLQRKVLWFQMIQPKISLRQWIRKLGAWVFSHLLNLVAGYGYRPERSFLAYLLVTFGFMGLYLLTSHLTTPHLRWDEALVLSLSSFHGRGFFPQTITLGDAYARLAVIEAVLGLFIEISFIATFTQRFFGK
jgi:uncharacterized protein YjbI with pentapeptide repeats